MELDNILKKIRTTFTLRKRVDFDDCDLHIEMEPLTTQEELKVLEACTNLDGAAYLEGLKKHSLAFAIRRLTSGGKDLDLSDNEYTYTEDDGSTKTVSKYLMLVEQIGEWPASLRDLLFEAFNNMQEELDSKIRESGKFERFVVNQPPSPEQTSTGPAGFKRVNVPEEDSSMSDAEKLTRRVEKEMDNTQAQMDRTEADAETKALRNG